MWNTKQIAKRSFLAISMTASALLALTACGQNPSGFAIKSAEKMIMPAPDNGGLSQTPPASSQPAATPAPGVYKTEAAPLWEGARPKDGTAWTAFAFGIVDQYGDSLLAGTSDIKTFCPAYFTLSRNEKINFWVYLVSAVSKYESDFSPVSRYQETTLGTDAVTNQPVWSEGLLQLSYQDTKTYTFCDEFNWSKDKALAAKDPAKSILDPFKNLECGIRILNAQVKRKDLIAVRGYWSTLFPTGTKISPIRALTNSEAYCKL
jgi:hypothetical protein